MAETKDKKEQKGKVIQLNAKTSSVVENILIGTPCYGGQLHIDYFHTILSFPVEYPHTVITIGNESLITRARNKIFSWFVNNAETYNFSHLLFMDADIGVDPRALKAFLDDVKPEHHVIGAPVRLKDFNRRIYNFSPLDGDLRDIEFLKEYSSKGELIKEVKKIGSAFMLIDLEAAKAAAEWAKDNNFTYISPKQFSRGDAEEDFITYDVFQVGVFNGEYLSEDFFFCKLMQDLGYKIYMNIGFIPVHNGVLPLV